MATRRTSFTEPGEPLAVSPSPVQSALRFGSWVEMVGCTEDDALVTPMSSVPLPLYQQDWGHGKHRWPGTRPEAMWHPLLWLPPHLAGRYSMTAADGSTMIESDDLWAVRLAYEMTYSGLYDEDTATWTDVLSLVDIDIDTPEGVDRVGRWLNGSRDADLDKLDLSPIFAELNRQQDDADWAIRLAQSEMDSLRVIAWSSAAGSLLDHCEDIAEESKSLEDTKQGVGLLAAMAALSFAQLPGGPRDGASGEAAWWARLSQQIEAFHGTLKELSEGLVEDMVGRLLEIHETYQPKVEQMVGAGVSE